MNNIYLHQNALSKNTCHFIAANGFHPKCYQKMFSLTENASFQSPLLRPLWSNSQKPTIDSWMVFVDDLDKYVKKYQPKIVMGHSIGVVLWMLYSIKYNYSFEKIIMLEPALFPKWMYYAYRIICGLRIQKQVHPLIKQTLKRKVFFNSTDDIHQKFSEKKVFQKMSPEVMADYIESGFEKTDSGYELKYSPQWEAEIYEKAMMEDIIIWDHLRRLSIGTELIYIRGEFSNVCTSSISEKLTQLCSLFYSYTVPDSTHLLPFEKPEEVAKIINLHLE